MNRHTLRALAFGFAVVLAFAMARLGGRPGTETPPRDSARPAAAWRSGIAAPSPPHVTPDPSSERARYGEARALARDGRFDEAEAMLEALAAGDPPHGLKARRYLAFDFHYEKMQWLMLNRRLVECESVGRMLLERDLTPDQVDWVEAVLDRVERFGGALSRAERAAALGACRHVTTALAQRYSEEERYPDRLAIEDFSERGAYADRSVPAGLSAIDDYRSTGAGYSFIAVSTKGRHRIRVVDGLIRP